MELKVRGLEDRELAEAMQEYYCSKGWHSWPQRRVVHRGHHEPDVSKCLFCGVTVPEEEYSWEED